MAKEIVNKVLDISTHQGLLTDTAVQKIKEAGMWVVLRIGYTGYESLKPAIDTVFEANYKKLHDAGVPCGAYYFTIAFNQTIAEAEAKFIVDTLRGKKFELPFYLDVEGQTASIPWTNLDGGTRAKMVRYICSYVESAGYYVGIYSSKSGFTSKWLDMSLLEHFDKWVAQYNIICTYNGTYGMWQYSSKESASKYGITKSAYVDINNAYYDFPTIIKTKGLNNYKNSRFITCPKCGELIEV